MAELTRRGFIRSTSLGAVTVGMLAVPGLATVTEAAAAPVKRTSSANHEPLVAYIRDAANGEISLMIGEREVVIRDHDLVARLHHAAR